MHFKTFRSRKKNLAVSFEFIYSYLSNVSFCFGLGLSDDLSLTSVAVLPVTCTSLAPAVAYGINFLVNLLFSPKSF